MAYRTLSSTGLPLSFGQCIVTKNRDCSRSGHPRKYNQAQARQETHKHRAKQLGCSLRCSAELLPDKHAPERRNHGRALPKPIRYGKSRASRSNDAKRHSDAPNDPAQDAGEMRAQTAFEVIAEANRRANERLLHDKGVQTKITEENANREHEHRCVRSELSRLGLRKVWI